MKPERLFPDRRYYTVMGMSIALILLISMFWWSVPGASVLLAEVMDPVIAVVIVIALHIALLWVALALGAAYVRRLRYEIQEDGVIVHAGIITKSVKRVPFRTVTNLKVTRGPIERLFGLGSLHVETAGTSGQNATAEAVLSGLGDVVMAYEVVAEHLSRFRTALAPTQSGNDVGVEVDRDDLMVALLDEVRAIRARLDDQDQTAQ